MNRYSSLPAEHAVSGMNSPGDSLSKKDSAISDGLILFLK
jgi:hypothetical protein